ncbi:amidase [Rhodospirillaceae bacterium SYSU D60014]|uniref:amidase n=1 Tax=Virgifigura deserti TaxID=2268457 RepID=UPI000E676574
MAVPGAVFDRQTLGALCPHGDIVLEPLAQGPLSGLAFAAKDNLDIAGHITGAGSPDWLRTHPPAERTAPSIVALLAAGARLTGKTVMDEIAWSLTGENAHYGTPLNPRNPDRIPGGSSSGSASAVAAGVVDFALGSDTSGSVRIPAAYCGIHGIRTTHGRLPLDGGVPLSPSFDCLGWFARDADLLRRVGEVYFGPIAATPAKPRFLLARDAFALVEEPVRDALGRTVSGLAPVREITIFDGREEDWLETVRVLQTREVWLAHGDWVKESRPTFGPGVRERFAAARALAQEDISKPLAFRQDVARRLNDLLGDDVLLVPGVAVGAPRRGSAGPVLDAYRRATLMITCIAGLGGLPQITLPCGMADGSAIGLGLIGARGSDERLLALACNMNIPAV